MDGGTLGAARSGRETRWGAVALGWVIALLAGIVLSTALRALYDLFSRPPVERDELTAGIVIVSLVSGFLSYLLGGYAAARTAGRSGGKHGVLTAFFGLLVGVVLALFGLVFTEGVAVPPAGFGLSGPALGAGLILFLTNAFGGFVGGELGEPLRLEPDHLA